MQTETTRAQHEKQLALPIAREERLALLRTLRRVKLSIVSPLMRSNLCDLLEQVEMNSGADGCRLSRDMLCAKLSIDLRTLLRWQKIAEELEVLEKAPRWLDGGKGRQAENLLRIDWYRVRRLVRESLPPVGETLFVHDWEADGETQSVHVTTGQAVPARVDSDVRARQISATPGEAIATPGVAFSTADQCVEAQPPAHQVPTDVGGVAEIESGGVANSKSATPMVNGTRDSHERRTIEPISLPRKDPISYYSTHSPLGGAAQDFATHRAPGTIDRCPLSLDLLRSPRGLEMWFEFALSRRWVRDVDQLRVFTLARCIMRRVDANPRLLDNPCGAFVSQVKRRKWIGIQEDETWARAAIARLEIEQK